MKTLYIDCSMGAAGDMLTAALLEIASQSAGGSREESGESGENGGCAARAAEFVRNFNALGIPGVEMEAYKDVKHGITGTRVRIRVNGEEEHAHDNTHAHDHAHCHEHAHFHHHDRDDAHEHAHDRDHAHCYAHAHRSMKDIEAVISGLALDDAVRADVLSVYRIIAEAEGEVHGRPAGEVHFHEVGAMDAVADVTAVCMLMHEIAADEIVASPVATGYGTVRCAHGLLPVPAPATAVILRGVPAYAGDVEGELCTPTGAALIKHFAEEYSQMPLMRTEAIGYGLGTKDFEKANCLRIFLGESV